MLKPVKIKKPKKLKPITFGNLVTEAQSKFYAGFVYEIKIGHFNYIGKKSFHKGEAWATYNGSGAKWKATYKSMIAQGFVPVYRIVELSKNDMALANTEETTIRSAWMAGVQNANLANNLNFDMGKGKMPRNIWLKKYLAKKT